MCSACINTDQPLADSDRWVSVETKAPGTRPLLWVKVDGEVKSATNDGTAILVDGVAVSPTHWLLRHA